MKLWKSLAVAATTLGFSVIPNSSYAAIIGVDFGVPSSSTPLNWTLVTGAGTTNNLVNENGNTTDVDISVSSDSLVQNFNASVLPSTIPTHTNPIDNIGQNLFSFSGDSLVVTFSDLIPNQTYSYWLFGLRDGGRGTRQSVVVNGASFTQNAASQVLIMNDELGDDARSLSSYAIPITADASGEIITTINPFIFSDLYAVAGIAIEEQEIPPTPEPTTLLSLFAVGAGFLVSKHKKQA